jgi:plastocyanin
MSTVTREARPVNTRRRAFVMAAIVPVVAVVAVVVTLAVTDAPGTGSASGAKPAGTSIVISNFAFSPRTLHVAPGTTIEVTNKDGVGHTLTADDGSFDTGILAGGAKGTITLESPGRYEYHCEIHNFMTGVIVVQ